MHLSKGGLSVGHRSVNGHGVGAEKSKLGEARGRRPISRKCNSPHGGG